MKRSKGPERLCLVYATEYDIENARLFEAMLPNEDWTQICYSVDGYRSISSRIKNVVRAIIIMDGTKPNHKLLQRLLADEERQERVRTEIMVITSKPQNFKGFPVIHLGMPKEGAIEWMEQNRDRLWSAALHAYEQGDRVPSLKEFASICPPEAYQPLTK